MLMFCIEYMWVVGNVCVFCLVGLENVVGDDVMGDDITCDYGICEEN